MRTARPWRDAPGRERAGAAADAPRLVVRLDALRSGRGAASWRATWRIRNDGPRTVTIHRAWHPHGRFRSARRAVALRIAPRVAGKLELPVRCDVRPGEIVANLFLILQVTSARRRWRVLARLRLRGRADAPPEVAVEAIEAHPAEP